MKYVATKPGFINSRLQQVGDEFEGPEGLKGSWLEAVEKPKAEKPKEPDSRKKTKVSKKTSKGK